MTIVNTCENHEILFTGKTAHCNICRMHVALLHIAELMDRDGYNNDRDYAVKEITEAALKQREGEAGNG